jgi:peptidoglycan L-alanyl-D-glutamate endopeptidase CwlK
MPSYSQKSEDRLNTASWDLQRLFREVVKHYDNTILEGHRGEYSQNKLFKQGKTKVQWPDGKHNYYPSKAVDVAPYPIPENWGADHWKDLVKFYEFAAVVKAIASQMGIRIRWGGDWDGDGDYKDQTFDDLVHFELLD